MLNDEEYHLRCMISFPIAILIYLSSAATAATMFPRKVAVRGSRPPIASFHNWSADINVSLLGLLSGTPMIQLFHVCNDKYGDASGMRLYKDPFQYGLIWAVAQIPIYLLMWDLTFYILHRWVLHHPLFYKLLHSGHHAFRPPTGWSGIAVGPLDVIFEGILPYTIPLFFGIPFHEYTVNAVNALLTFHACVLHSSCHAEYGNLSGFLGWLMISPIGHNMHHQYGLKNACNFAPIFKIWDRWLGTLNETEPFWWKTDRKQSSEIESSKGK
ncbi:hypothetical protein TrVE_jg1301 [Triparma verrucosa]|uniref:Fatty acid hydroxylase domain-containing protein n=1 Tax=Triparma verrucosa TaxID=1606542 RepID=A0A9W7BNG8_9STRA|nr:hypothetical protein TrVE_jg1301 [Triparma verrucosa]